MAEMRYVVTGGTGFIGGRVISRVFGHPAGCSGLGAGPPGPPSGGSNVGRRSGTSQIKPLLADLTELDLTDETIAELGQVDHVVHCAAIYDITAGEAERRGANVEGTRAVIELTKRLNATLHHVSSIAVAGDFAGEFTEDDFDVGQQLPTPYHQTKFEAEMLVRSTPGLRPPHLPPRGGGGRFAPRPARWTRSTGRTTSSACLSSSPFLPRFTPLMLPDTGRTNIVPVDYVADALVALMHIEGPRWANVPPDRAENHWAARYLLWGSPMRRAYRHCADHCPAATGRTGAEGARHGGAGRGRNEVPLPCWEYPPEVFDVVDLKPDVLPPTERVTRCRAQAFQVPESQSYAPKLWRYWAEHLDPDRARRDDAGGTAGGVGTSSSPAHPAGSAGHRRSPSHERGATVFALVRNADALDTAGRRDSRQRWPGTRLHL